MRKILHIRKDRIQEASAGAQSMQRYQKAKARFIVNLAFLIETIRKRKAFSMIRRRSVRKRRFHRD